MDMQSDVPYVRDDVWMARSVMCIWDMYFASLCAMTLHPGAGSKDHQRLSFREVADLVDDMLRIRAERLCR